MTSDVGQHDVCTLLSIRQTASLDQFRWPRHDGFWFTCGTGRQNGVARRNRGLRHWRRQYSDERQELSTALQYELPVLVVDLNNRYLGMVKQWQDMISSGHH